MCRLPTPNQRRALLYFVSKSRDQDQNEQRNHTEQHGAGIFFVRAVGRAAHYVDDRDSQPNAKKLALEVMIRVGEPCQGWNGAGAVDHYESEGNQQGHLDPELDLQGERLPGEALLFLRVGCYGRRCVYRRSRQSIPRSGCSDGRKEDAAQVNPPLSPPENGVSCKLPSFLCLFAPSGRDFPPVQAGQPPRSGERLCRGPRMTDRPPHRASYLIPKLRHQLFEMIPPVRVALILVKRGARG